MIETNRRKFLSGLVGIIAAPAIVKVTSLMPVRAFAEPDPWVRFVHVPHGLFVDNVSLYPSDLRLIDWDYCERVEIAWTENHEAVARAQDFARENYERNISRKGLIIANRFDTTGSALTEGSNRA